jgi:hypothetical protein
MKKTILAMILMVGAATISYAQCDKNYTITTSKTEYYDGSGALQRTVDEKGTITVTGKDIVITHGPNDEKMNGGVKYDTCSWKVPFKEGKTVIRTTLNGDNGQNTNVTLTIEGKDGKISVTAVPDEDQTRQIRLTVDKFEEKK